MRWHLDFQFDPLNEPASFTDKILMSGSCFAEDIGNFLTKYKLDAVINPHGILYNPVSIVKSLQACLEGKQYTASDLFYHNGLWHSPSHHGSFSHPDQQVCLQRINDSVHSTHQRLLQADWVILTLGTTGVYRWKKNGEIVGNCHKLPGREFDLEFLEPDDIINVFNSFFERLLELNQKVKIIFTVSPVRYIKYGLVKNNLSKSVLLCAIHRLTGKYKRTFYFPAYEIVIDELRDYRFYAEDLVHPNGIAAQFVWERFESWFLGEPAKEILNQIKPVVHAAQHRPLHEESDEYRKFVKMQLDKIAGLEKMYPFVSFAEEKKRPGK